MESLPDIALVVPSAVPEPAQEAIGASLARLERAERVGDGPQIIGSAKELVECVAKTVLAARGHVPPADLEFGKLVGQAHKGLERQPGAGLAADPPVRDVATGLSTIARALGPLRNSHGSGHGRAYEPEVADEMLQVVVPAALLWCRWALNRLEHLLAGDLEPLIADLRGANWYSGDLTARLTAAGLPELTPEDQHRLGVAVGQRTLNATFNVRIEGVDACAHSDDVQRWPRAYRLGVLEGSLISEQGYFVPTASSLEAAARIIAPLPDAAEALDELVQVLEPAPLAAHLLADPAARQELKRAGSEWERILPAAARPAWQAMRSRLEP